MSRPQLRALDPRPSRLPLWHRPTASSLVTALVGWPLLCLGGPGVALLLPGCFLAMHLWGRQAFLPALLGQGAAVAVVVSCSADPKPRRRRERARAEALAAARRSTFCLVEALRAQSSPPP